MIVREVVGFFSRSRVLVMGIVEESVLVRVFEELLKKVIVVLVLCYEFLGMLKMIVVLVWLFGYEKFGVVIDMSWVLVVFLIVLCIWVKVIGWFVFIFSRFIRVF